MIITSRNNFLSKYQNLFQLYNSAITEKCIFSIDLKKITKRNSHIISLDNHLRSYENYENLKSFLPRECFTLRRKLDNLYLIDSGIAEKVVEHILPCIKKNTSHLIAECFPGLGLITEELLKNDVPAVKLFEPTIKFHECLKELDNKYPGKIQISDKNLFRISQFEYLDKLDNGKRVEEIVKDIPRKRWRDDPCLSIIGTCVHTLFFDYLVKALVLQTTFVTYGRIEMFFMMKPNDYLVVTNDKRFQLRRQRYVSILINLFFDYEVMEIFPREAFLPWQSKKSRIKEIHEDKIFLVHLVVKEKLPLPLDDLVPFYFFIKRLFSERTKIIPTLETWVPDCGENIIWPKLPHSDYYENIGIYSVFGELSHSQILEVFLEMYHHPNYPGSSFMEMVETQLIKSETIESSSNYMTSNLERNIADDIRKNES